MGKKKITDKKIASLIVVPQQLPISMNKEAYIQDSIVKIRKELNRGMSLEKAVYKVTGSMPKKVKSSGSSVFITPTKRRKQERKNRILGVIAAISITITAAAGYTVLMYKPHTTSAIAEDNLTGTNQNEMILVAGLDTRPLVDQGSGNSEDVPGTRTDMLALVSIPEDGSRATIVSIPRDTSVTRSECNQYDTDSGTYINKTVPSQQDVKINSVYGEGGPKCLVNTINDTFDININRYMEIDFEIFKHIVDAMGGIDITTDGPVVDDTLGTIIGDAGTVTLKGEKALDYVRARKVSGTAKNDFERIQRQQQFFSSLMKKITEENKMMDASFLSNVAKNVLPNLKEDNVSLNDLAQLGYSLSQMKDDSIRMTSLPISSEDMMGNLIIDEDKTKILFDMLKNNTPLRGDEISNNSDNSSEATTVELNTMRVLIMAHTVFDERAIKLRDYLSSKGIDAFIVTSEKMPENSTMYVDKKNYNQVATIAELYPDINITSDDAPIQKTSERTVILSIGDNYDEVYSEPQKHKAGTKYHIPSGFNGKGYDIVPRELPGMNNYSGD